MKIKEKMKFLRESKGITQEDLAKLSGVSIQSIRRYESKDNANITFDNLEKIAKALDTNLEFFVSQCLPMSPNIENFLSTNVHQCPPMSTNQKKMSPSVSLSQKPDLITIPVYDEVLASAGFGRINEEYVSFYTSFDKAFLKAYFKLSNLENLSFIRCDGDSMTPALPPNARLLAQHRNEFKEGQIVLARIDEDLFVKRLQKQPFLKLLSDNPAYEAINLENKDYELLAVVIGFLKNVE